MLENNAQSDMDQTPETDSGRENTTTEDSRTYTSEEFKALVAQRDAAKQKVREYEASKAIAEQQALEESGKWQEAHSILKSELDKVKVQAEKAQKLEEFILDQVKIKTASLPAEVRKSVEALQGVDPATLLNHVESLQSTISKAPKVPAGAAPSSAAPVDISSMSPNEAREYFKTLSAKERKELLNQLKFF